MSAGILMSCYVALAGGQYDWVVGHETAILKAGKLGQERSYFVPTAANIPARAVETNDCKYLEDPVLATVRQLEAKKIGAIKTGNAEWCHVDNYGHQTCTYANVASCMRRAARGEYCEPNAD